MEFAFPGGLRLIRNVPVLQGMRHDPFTNIDGEPFGQPSMSGHWQIQMQVLVDDERSKLALSAFITGMQMPQATCLVPVRAIGYPSDDRGVPVSGGKVSPEYGADHLGYEADPAPGYQLRAAAAHRHSFVDVTKPRLSQLLPGHMLSIGDRLYQAVQVTAIDELETAVRVSVLPLIRGAHETATPVIVDRLRVRCHLLDGDQIGRAIEKQQSVSLNFIEAF